MKTFRLMALALLALAAHAYADSPHKFSLDVSKWEIKPKTVHVAGTFNGWKADGLALKQAGNVWSGTTNLPDGVTQYKFVIDGSRWIQDPKADAALDADDGNGGKNSGVRTGPGSNAVVAGHVFALDVSSWDIKPKGVTVTGDFNGWNKESVALKAKGNVWSASVPLADGVHYYKFVIDNDRYISDPKEDDAFKQDDGFGGHNSGVLIGPDARKLPPPTANHIEARGLRFDAKELADTNVVDDTTLRVRIRTQANDVEHVYLRYGGPNTAEWSKIELNRLGTVLGYEAFGGTVAVEKALADQPIKFYFELDDGSAEARFANGKVVATDAAAQAAATAVNLTPTFVTPAWARDAVWYQIFPERFRNGDTANDPDNSESQHMIRWTSKWFDTQPGEAPGQENFYGGKGNVWKRRYGGDIQGVQQSLPYLKKLGINAIYFNPVFEAESMHKYDATDYRHIDNHFGVKGDWPVAGETDDPATWKWSPSDKVFLDFIAEAHKQGIKVVIDGVLNHVGRPHPFFQDVLENGKNSKFADWFDIADFGDPANWHKMTDPYAVHGKPGGIQWNAWDGKNGALPAWKKDAATGIAAAPAEHIFAITRRWLAPDGDPTRGVDGFRLDAAEQIPHPFWVKWREVVKKAKPDAYISGEIWNPAQPWINAGDQFDAVMNYQFAMPAQAFFVNQKNASKPSDFLARLTEIVYMYPQQSSLVMMNLFDSHDTDRLASMFVNPDLAYDGANRLQDEPGKNYSSRKPNEIERRKMMLAVACQMTFLGAPMIYYGDEAGMWSADDPSDRQPMTWPEMKFDDPEVGFNQAIFDEYQKLIATRESLPALKHGDFFPVLANDADGTVVYGRRLDGKTDRLRRVESQRLDASGRRHAKLGSLRWREWHQVDGHHERQAGAARFISLEPYGYAILAAEPLK